MLPIGDENPHPPGFKPKLTYALIAINVIIFLFEVAVTDGGSGPSFNYAEIVSPLIAGGIVASSLFFVKSINDKRRIDKMLS